MFKKSRAFGSKAIFLSLFFFTTVGFAQQRISMDQLEEMFAGMRADTKWNVEGPLLWGYFFYDRSESKLQSAADALRGGGYRVVGIETVPGERLYVLHVERVEIHTPASLDARNQELYALAEKYSLQSYDGMDVGPAPETPK